MYESLIYNQQRQNQINFDQRVSRGDFNPMNQYRHVNTPIGIPNYIKEPKPLFDPEPRYNANSFIDCRTPLQKNEVYVDKFKKW
jgi:hypothetical protein